ATTRFNFRSFINEIAKESFNASCRGNARADGNCRNSTTHLRCSSPGVYAACAKEICRSAGARRSDNHTETTADRRSSERCGTKPTSNAGCCNLAEKVLRDSHRENLF